MNIKSITTIYFSPTGGTRRMATVLTDRLSSKLSLPANVCDITLQDDRSKDFSLPADTLVIAVFPTYAGKLPNKLLPDLSRIFQGGAGQPAVPVVTFGNRSFDNSLAELAHLLDSSGFNVIGGAAFVSEHPFSDKLGTFRPDPMDYSDIEKFATIIERRLSDFPESIPDFPGDANAPYYTPLEKDGSPAKFLKATPVTKVESCINCGACAKSCPMSVVDPLDVTNTTGPCIKCHACIHVCPTLSRSFQDEAFLSHKTYLEEHFTKRKANVLV